MAAKLALPGTITVTTAGTRVPLSATSLPTNSVLIQADTANTGYIYVGDSTVASTNGHVLSAGDAIEIRIDVNGRVDEVDLADIYVDASVNSQKARVSVIRRK
jgi:hypothetical protein